ncbi:hypothetical protein RHMOL_Rhmol05G0161400 [Rhododendron molle]|uniref:Uncharacterized protein n=1 Tax=Rhododendron molle TaxID=49168 RepID=A0ACC0NR26_RHOML|nr:hypothetical protein RHMOL_Rhmol05G0161400 [Rhododendron molle]
MFPSKKSSQNLRSMAELGNGGGSGEVIENQRTEEAQWKPNQEINSQGRLPRVPVQWQQRVRMTAEISSSRR